MNACIIKLKLQSIKNVLRRYILIVFHMKTGLCSRGLVFLIISEIYRFNLTHKFLVSFQPSIRVEDNCNIKEIMLHQLKF